MTTPSACDVCSVDIHPLAYLCKRCKRFIDRVDARGRPNRDARIKALKRAWDGEAFRCYYSGVALVEDNPKDPRYVTFDHRTPRIEGDIVLAAAAINDMKSDMSEREFRSMVAQLAERFSGGKLEEKAFKLKFWKR